MKQENLLDLSLFILRTVIGLIFVFHGAQKLFGMFGGIGLSGTARMVEGMGLAYPYILAVIWASIEFIGGIFLMLGVIARWSAMAIVLTVLVLLWKANIMHGFFITDGGIESYLLIIGACIPIILLGGGSWSLWDV